MELSTRVEYALAALLELACQTNSNQPVRVKDIADAQGIPDRYLEHILIALRRAGFVYAQRGLHGGYLLAREPQQITILEVLNCLDDRIKTIEQAAVSLNRSVVRSAWQEVHLNARALLQQLTLQDLCHQRSRQQEISSLMYHI